MSNFVSHANKHHKGVYVQAFAKGDLHCLGLVGGGSCPHGFKVTNAQLEFLHL